MIQITLQPHSPLLYWVHTRQNLHSPKEANTMNTVIYNETTIAYDQLGYDLICERAVKDITTLVVVAIALAYWVYTTVKPHVVKLVERIETEVEEFDIEILEEAVQDLVREPAERIGYTYTTLRTYYIQLVTPAHEEDWRAFDELI